MSEEIFVGIDVSGERLDVCMLPEGKAVAFDNSDEGARALCESLSQRAVSLVALEATGGLERVALAALRAAGIPAVAANPRRVRQYAQAAGIMAKTDKVDARVLARFARDIRPESRPGPSPQEQVIRELAARRRQLMRMRVAELNRRKRAGDARVVEDIELSLAFLDERIKMLDDKIDEEIGNDPKWKEIDELLKSVPAVGEKTSRMLIASLPEIGSLTHKEAASLAGLAPFAHDSGKLKGKRMIRGGRWSVRNALYMATLVGITHNEDIRKFYRRLKNNGKPGKVALTACMRKLLITLNAVVARGTKWTPKNA